MNTELLYILNQCQLKIELPLILEI